MTRVFDAAALIGWFNEEPCADEVDELFGDAGGAASVLDLAEVVDNLVRLSQVRATHIGSVIDALLADGLQPIACDVGIARRAGEIRAANYRKATMEVSLADCVAVATAESVGGTLVTSDAELVQLASRLGVPVHPIANSSGVRPGGEEPSGP